jgi:hypothetical protein
VNFCWSFVNEKRLKIQKKKEDANSFVKQRFFILLVNLSNGRLLKYETLGVANTRQGFLRH